MDGIKIFSFDPIFDKSSKVLILGTMPSSASIAAGMYYSHPRNAFWRILKDLTGKDIVDTKENKRLFLLANHIAVWDTLSMCERIGSLDENIKKEVPNKVAELIELCPDVKIVFLNGGGALKYYKRYHASNISLPYISLPSTSPANARGGYEKKLESWKVVANYL